MLDFVPTKLCFSKFFGFRRILFPFSFAVVVVRHPTTPGTNRTNGLGTRQKHTSCTNDRESYFERKHISLFFRLYLKYRIRKIFIYEKKNQHYLLLCCSCVIFFFFYIMRNTAREKKNIHGKKKMAYNKTTIHT